jgi:hypothetical protein
MAGFLLLCPYYSKAPSTQYKCSHYLILFSHYVYIAGCFLSIGLFVLGKKRELISEDERSKAWVFGRSLVGIAGSNPAGGMDACFL